MGLFGLPTQHLLASWREEFIQVFPAVLLAEFAGLSREEGLMAVWTALRHNNSNSSPIQDYHNIPIITPLFFHKNPMKYHCSIPFSNWPCSRTHSWCTIWCTDFNWAHQMEWVVEKHWYRKHSQQVVSTPTSTALRTMRSRLSSLPGRCRSAAYSYRQTY